MLPASGMPMVRQKVHLSYSFINEVDQVYKKIVISEDTRYLLGAVMVGCTEDYANWLQLYLNQMELPEYPESLLVPYTQKKARLA